MFSLTAYQAFINIKITFRPKLAHWTLRAKLRSDIRRPARGVRMEVKRTWKRLRLVSGSPAVTASKTPWQYCGPSPSTSGTSSCCSTTCRTGGCSRTGPFPGGFPASERQGALLLQCQQFQLRRSFSLKPRPGRCFNDRKCRQWTGSKQRPDRK